MPAGLRPKNKATKLFKKIMSPYEEPDRNYYRKKKREQTPWMQNLPGSSSPNGIGPIF